MGEFISKDSKKLLVFGFQEFLFLMDFCICSECKDNKNLIKSVSNKSIKISHETTKGH